MAPVRPPRPAMMAPTPMCRVCLAGKRKMVNIDSIQLLEFYEKLTDTKLNAEAVNGIGNAVCYICNSELLKCHKFNQKANKSLECMQEMLKNGIQVTPEMVTEHTPAKKPCLTVSRTQYMFVNDKSKTGTLTFKEEKLVKAEKNAVETGDKLKKALNEGVDGDIDFDELKFAASDEEGQGNINDDEFMMKALKEVRRDNVIDRLKFEASDEEVQDDDIDEMKSDASDEEVEGDDDIDKIKFEASDEEVQGDDDIDEMKFEASDEEFHGWEKSS